MQFVAPPDERAKHALSITPSVTVTNRVFFVYYKNANFLKFSYACGIRSNLSQLFPLTSKLFFQQATTCHEVDQVNNMVRGKKNRCGRIKMPKESELG